MRKLLAAMFAVAALFAFATAVVLYAASSISSSPARTPAHYALESESTAPGVAEAEQCACAHCSTFVTIARIVKTVIETVQENAIASTVGTALKLPSAADVNSEVRDASSADCVEVEVLGVGV